jgi:hypothetical protein
MAITNDKDARARYLDLEPEICDLDRMAEITLGLVNGSLDDMVEPTRKHELADYAVDQLRKRCAELKELWYRGHGE